jgi:uncharacterized protein YbaP (TraB family)
VLKKLLAVLFAATLLAGCAKAQSLETQIADNPEASGEVTPKERPFLWVIEGEVPSYLYGTIHLPDPRVTTLPPVVEQAILASDELNTEIPMDLFTMGRAAFAMIAPAGERLSAVLPADLYQRADAILQEYNQSISTYENFKVWGLLAILPQLEYISKGQTEALDQKIYSFAIQNGKKAGGIESVNEQLSVFDSTSQEDLLSLLRTTIEQIEKSKSEAGESPTELLLRGYLTGDMDTVVDYVQEEQDPDDPVQQRFMQKLLGDRNHRMAERIDKKLTDDPERSYFFAIGLLHYPLEDGLLELLAGRGYTITRLEPGMELPVRKAVAVGNTGE